MTGIRHTVANPDVNELEEITANAKCRGHTRVMYADNLHVVNLAKAVCYRCPVIDRCREYALEHHEQFGVWGGLSMRERERIWKRQRRNVA